MASPSKVWLITGASTGIGKAVTEYALAQGDRVVATLRKPEALSSLSTKYPSTQLLLVAVNVTISEDIYNAFAQAAETFGRVDIVYNNAGIALLGEVEGTSDEASKKVFEVNFWSAVNVSTKAVKFFREVNEPRGGRLINVSTLAAIHPTPGLGFYGASRAALEVVSESLSQELNPEWNIKVSILVLGPFETMATVTGLTRLPVHPAYAEPPTMASLQARYWVTKGGGDDPNKATIQIFNLAKEDNPPIRLILTKAAIGAVKASAQSLIDTAEKYAERSGNLGFS